MSNSVCRVCGPNCVDELPLLPVVPVDEAVAPLADDGVPLLWPSVARSDANGSDWALEVVGFDCNSDCHSANGLLLLEPTDKDIKRSLDTVRVARGLASPGQTDAKP